jgi:NADH:ubiquinone oxidoreductase subunit E
MDAQVIDSILKRHPKDPSSIIQVMLDIQNELYYLPRDVLKYISAYLDVPPSRTYSLATFYKAFSLKPKGKHPISVCTGTACHVQGAVKIMEQLERQLRIKEGETTPDNKFSVQSVRCLGCCGLAPVITVGKSLHGKVPASKVSKILNQYE